MKDNFKESLIIIIGFIIISFVFWKRFIRYYLPKSLDDFSYIYNSVYTKCIFAISIITSVVIIISIYRIWGKYRPKDKETSSILDYIL